MGFCLHSTLSNAVFFCVVLVQAQNAVPLLQARRPWASRKSSDLFCSGKYQMPSPKQPPCITGVRIGTNRREDWRRKSGRVTATQEETNMTWALRVPALPSVQIARVLAEQFGKLGKSPPRAYRTSRGYLTEAGIALPGCSALWSCSLARMVWTCNILVRALYKI